MRTNLTASLDSADARNYTVTLTPWCYKLRGYNTNHLLHYTLKLDTQLSINSFLFQPIPAMMPWCWCSLWCHNAYTMVLAVKVMSHESLTFVTHQNWMSNDHFLPAYFCFIWHWKLRHDTNADNDAMTLKPWHKQWHQYYDDKSTKVTHQNPTSAYQLAVSCFLSFKNHL